MLQTIATAPKTFLATTDSDLHTIDELIKRRALQLKDVPLLGYPKSGVVDYEEHSACAVDKYTDAAAEALQKRGIPKADGSLEKAPVVAILAHSGLHYILTLLGLSRLGYAVLLLSTRLPSPAISRLLELADCNKVLTTDGFHPVLAEVQRNRDVEVIEILAHADYYNVDAPEVIRSYNPDKEIRKIAIIIHSSGSTGLPKPIYLTHGNCLAAFATNLDMRALITSPLFHSQGFYETFRSIYSGKPIYYCNYALPLTKQNLTSMIDHVKPDLLHCVPYVLKLLAETEEGVRCLANLKTVLFGGSACPDDLGDRLVRNGVQLVANYGATETGRLMNSVRAPGDDAWNYLRVLPQAKPYVFWDEIAPGVFECVALDGLKSKSTINSDNPPRSFRTRDLFSPHPTREGLWKYLSRLDDRLTLTMGEKVLPLPIEGRIRQENLVQEVAIFGEGRTVPGVLVIKAESAAHLSDEDFLEAILPAIEDANSRAESYSRIPKELVVVLPANTTYPKTDKGTFIRAQIYTLFKQQIDDVYEKFESAVEGTKALDIPELEEYLMTLFRDQLSVALESVETDFFAFGIDSLQCIRMWNLLKKNLDLGGRQSELGQNVLYETGNVRHLARYLYGLRTGTVDEFKDERQIMHELVAKYSIFSSVIAQKVPRLEQETVLLTGVTGGLGAHLLAQLVAKQNVSAVWTLVRASSDEEAFQRVRQSLEVRGLHLGDDHLSKIVPLASDLSLPDFGLGPSRTAKLRSSLTLAIHSAWAVNFNIPVQSFENQHIKAVHNLIEFCQSTPFDEPARFFFCSSVSATGGTPRPGTVPESQVQDIAHVQGTGYARSKYVAEQIVHKAAEDARIEARVLRVGQLVGDSQVGVWNATEGIPLMIQTAKTVGALPALDEEMTWLPVDNAASIILDLCRINTASDRASKHSEQPLDPKLVYHVLNPNRFHWSRDMLPSLSAAGLQFETLSTQEWMERLRASSRDPEVNPPIKLLDWFESKYGCGMNPENVGPLEYQTEETEKASETIRNVQDVTDKAFVALLLKWLTPRW